MDSENTKFECNIFRIISWNATETATIHVVGVASQLRRFSSSCAVHYKCHVPGNTCSVRRYENWMHCASHMLCPSLSIEYSERVTNTTIIRCIMGVWWWVLGGTGGWSTDPQPQQHGFDARSKQMNFFSSWNFTVTSISISDKYVHLPSTSNRVMSGMNKLITGNKLQLNLHKEAERNL